jgi:hypothetical protein
MFSGIGWLPFADVVKVAFQEAVCLLVIPLRAGCSGKKVFLGTSGLGSKRVPDS